MSAKIQKWGNSLAVRIPMQFAEMLSLKEGSSINIKVINNQLAIQPALSELDELVNKINAENRHKPIFNGASIGKEIW